MEKSVFKDHRVAEIEGVRAEGDLTEPDALLQRARSLAKRLRLTTLEEYIKPFEPRDGEEKGGITLVFVIGESHLAIHTWALERYIHIDAFSCSQHTNMRNFRKIVTSEFPADRVRTRKIKYP